MKLKISLTEKKNELLLENGGKTVSRSVWQEKNNISRKLLLEISKILKRNNLEPKDLKKIETHSTLPSNFTAFRIAKTVSKVFKCALALDKKIHKC